MSTLAKLITRAIFKRYATSVCVLLDLWTLRYKDVMPGFPGNKWQVRSKASYLSHCNFPKPYIFTYTHPLTGIKKKQYWLKSTFNASQNLQNTYNKIKINFISHSLSCFFITINAHSDYERYHIPKCVLFLSLIRVRFIVVVVAYSPSPAKPCAVGY